MKIRIFFYFFTLLAIIISEASALLAAQPQTAVLLYHHLLPDADNKAFQNNGLVISQESFISQMEYLYKNNYHTVTTGELRAFLYDKKPLPPKSVMITFDDGYLSNYIFAYPILKQYGFKAVIFAITGNIENSDQDYMPDQLDMLSWPQIAESSDVFEYGSHTDALHKFTNGKTAFVSAPLDTARADLRYSQSRLGDTKIFAYPLGQYNAGVVDMLKNNAIDLAFTTNNGYVNLNSDPLLLNRVTVFADLDLATFERVVDCKYVFN